MLQSIVPPMVGATEVKSPPGKMADKDFKGSESGTSFGKALEEKINSKSPKEAKDSRPKEMKGREKEAQESSTEEKKNPEVVKTDGYKNKKDTVRQQKIKEFMDSLESEFQISPTRLVEAMSQLSDTQLKQSPEKTAEAVIEQFGLSDADESKAQAMYASLLTQLNQVSQAPKAPEFVVGTGVNLQGIQTRVDHAQSKLDKLSATVDHVNQKFWSTLEKPQASSLDSELTTNAPLEKMMVDENSFAEGQEPQVKAPIPQEVNLPKPPAAANPLKDLPPHLQGQMRETMSPSLITALAAQKAAASKLEGELPQTEEGLSLDQGAGLMEDFNRALDSKVAPKALASEHSQLADDFFSNQSQGQDWLKQSNQSLSQDVSTEVELEGEDSSVTSSDFKQSLQGVEGLHAAPIKGEGLRLDAAVPTMGPVNTVTQNEDESSVKQVMSQAQYLIKKGGGEMKVQMTPEGMGTIHLKVMLQDGKVNLQMAADTQEAKKVIESSLAELKTSLAGHKLSMENVKVDVVNSTSADTAMQNQTNTNGQHQRDQTRQFWNQFNENFGSQGRRESFAEMPSLKGYGNRGRDPLQPIETRNVTRKVEGKGSGLNLVA